MFFLPSRGRPHNMERFLASYRSTGAIEPVRVRLDKDDDHIEAYKTISYPDHWTVEIGERAHCAILTAEHFREYPKEPYYGLLGDDLVAHTDGWDRRLVEAAGSDRLAYCRDGWFDDYLSCHPVVGGDLVRAIKWLSLPGLIHTATDSVLFEIAKATARLVYLPDVMVEHRHPFVAKAEIDATYSEAQRHLRADRKLFSLWMRHPDGLAGAVARVRETLG